MKRYSNLYQQIINKDNILKAIKNASKSNGRNSLAKARSIKLVKENIEKVALVLESILSTNTYKVSNYSIYPLFDPKLRLVYCLPFYPDRIIHHAILNIVSPIWDNLMFSGSYACRTNKGQHSAGTKCAEYIRQYKYCAQFDISQFYINLSHPILKQIIRNKIKDKNLLFLLDTIIDSIDTRNKNIEILTKMKEKGNTHPDIQKEINKLTKAKNEFPNESAGCPIGSYTSQWFGNLYMNECDTFIKQKLKIKALIRYCDDFLIFSNDKQYLQYCKQEITKFLYNNLHLLLSKAEVFPTTQGIDFVGYRYFPNNYVLLRKSSAKKQKNKFLDIKKQYHNGKLTNKEAEAKLASMQGWLNWANSYNFKQKLNFDSFLKEIKNA